MDISVQSYDVYLNGKFFADRMLNQKNKPDVQLGRICRLSPDFFVN